MTDEMVARKLGWSPMDESRKKESYWYRHKKLDGTQRIGCPKLTTDLNLIVTEIEAKKLKFRLLATEYGLGYEGEIRGFTVCEAKTAPLALCAALLQYLKEKS